MLCDLYMFSTCHRSSRASEDSSGEEDFSSKEDSSGKEEPCIASSEEAEASKQEDELQAGQGSQ